MEEETESEAYAYKAVTEYQESSKIVSESQCAGGKNNGAHKNYL